MALERGAVNALAGDDELDAVRRRDGIDPHVSDFCAVSLPANASVAPSNPKPRRSSSRSPTP